MKKPYHNLNLKDDILKKTLEIIHLEGYHNVSTRKLGSVFNVSAAAIYRHYTNTHDLFEAALSVASKELSDYLRSDLAAEDSILDKLLKTANRYVSFARENKHSFDFLFLSPYSKKQVEVDHNSRYDTLTLFSDLVREFKNVYQLDDSEEMIMAQLWSFIFGYAILVRENSLEYDERTIETMIVRYIKEGA